MVGLRVFLLNGMLNTQKNSISLWSMGGIFRYCILIYLDWTKYYEINMHS